jgi:acetoacetyl-CoA synthetase
MEPIWSPSPERIARTQLTRFMRFVRERHRAPVPDYAALHRWSIEFPENFWSALWDFCEIVANYHGHSCAARPRVSLTACAPPGCSRAIASQLTCRTFPRQ